MENDLKIDISHFEIGLLPILVQLLVCYRLSQPNIKPPKKQTKFLQYFVITVCIDPFIVYNSWFCWVWRRLRSRRRLIVCVVRCGGAARAGQWSVSWWQFSLLALWYSLFCLLLTCCQWREAVVTRPLLRRRRPRRQAVVDSTSRSRQLSRNH